MDDKLNFDTLDVLAAAIGVVIAFMILPNPVDRMTERIVVPLCMLAIVTLKRFFIRTREPNPESNTSIRMIYLLIAIIGTICMGIALLAMVADLQELNQPDIVEVMLGSGIALLIVATFIDRRWLKL
jgi:FtsH-binding integral membrane protein